MLQQNATFFQPRHKRRKHSSQSGIESKRPRSFDDDNSVDDDWFDDNSVDDNWFDDNSVDDDWFDDNSIDRVKQF